MTPMITNELYTLEEGPPGLTGPWTQVGTPAQYGSIRERLAQLARSRKVKHSYRILDEGKNVTNLYDPTKADGWN